MTNSLYRIRGAKVTSPFPMQLTPAEIRLVHCLERFFAPENIFADFYLPKAALTAQASSVAQFTRQTTASDHQLTQIDCLALNPQGIFVFESKDLAGWIYGRDRDRNWTTTLNFGREKHQFYNPIKQNQLHIAALQSSLRQDPTFSSLAPIIQNTLFTNIIVFGSTATLKSIQHSQPQTHITTQANLRTLLTQLTSAPPLLDRDTVAKLRQLLGRIRINPTYLTRTNHIAETPHREN